MDAIDNANSKSAGKDTGYVSTPKKSSETKSERIAKLPRVKTPEIIEREKEATAQSSKADSDRSTLLQKEEVDVEIKKETFTDTPQAYTKVEKYIEACVKINTIRDERIKTSNENVKKSKKSFTYPMKKVDKKQPQEPAPELPIAKEIESGERPPAPPPPTPSVTPSITPSPTPQASTQPSPSPTATPSPTPSPSRAVVKGDFYAKTTLTMGVYGLFTVYYKDKRLFPDATYRGKNPAVVSRAEIDKYLSRRTCSGAASLLDSGAKEEWLNDPRILDGCISTLSDMSGGFSIGESNIIIE